MHIPSILGTLLFILAFSPPLLIAIIAVMFLASCYSLSAVVTL